MNTTTSNKIYIKGRDVMADALHDLQNLHLRTYKVRLDDGASMPVRAHNTDVGYDVTIKSFEYSKEMQVSTRLIEESLEAGEDGVTRSHYHRYTAPIPCHITVDTGIAVQMDEQDGRAHCISVDAVPNSRMSKPPFVLGNSLGTIDPGYTGTIKFIYDVLPSATWEDINERFKIGATIGQLKFSVVLTPGLRRVDTLDDTDRGDGGFGSTEKTVDTAPETV